MAAKDVAVGERLLRPHWVELTDRVWADNVTDKLYEREILSKRDKDKIEAKSCRDRREGAALLLDMMSTRSWSQCVEFAVIVSETEGVKDLGKKLLEDAGFCSMCNRWMVGGTGWMCCVGCRRRGCDGCPRQKDHRS